MLARNLLTVAVVACTLSLAGCRTTDDEGELVWDLASESHLASWFPNSTDPTADAPSSENGDTRLAISTGQRVDFYLRLPNSSRLTIVRCEHTFSSGAGVSVSVQRFGEAEVISSDFRCPAGKQMLALPDGQSEITRLSLTAAGESSVRAEEAGSKILLFAPQIRVDSRLAGTSVGRPVPRTPAVEPPDVIIYLVDTLRADHLGVYGYDRPTSPHIDAFAEEALVFKNAIAQSSWTKPSVASLFTGLDTGAHGVLDNDSLLPDSLTTLAETLSENGYNTLGVQTNHIVGEKFNFGQGFDRYVRVGHRVNSVTERILRDRDPERPTFLYVHTIRPHNPYRPATEFKERFAPGAPEAYGETEFLKSLRYRRPDPKIEQAARDLYDGEIAFNDHQFGEFLDILRRQELFSNSLIIFLSDHGEELWDHGGWGHGHTLYREVLQVPLIIKEPREARTGNSDALVRLIDVFPTVLDYAGIEKPPAVSGSSIRFIDGLPESRVAVSSVERHGGIPEFPKMSIQDQHWKLIQSEGPDEAVESQLFDLDSDFLESHNLMDSEPIIAGYLKAQLVRHQMVTASVAAAESAELDEETIRQLRALGYIN